MTRRSRLGRRQMHTPQLQDGELLGLLFLLRVPGKQVCVFPLATNSTSALPQQVLGKKGVVLGACVIPTQESICFFPVLAKLWFWVTITSGWWVHSLLICGVSLMYLHSSTIEPLYTLRSSFSFPLNLPSALSYLRTVPHHTATTPSTVSFRCMGMLSSVFTHGYLYVLWGRDFYSPI